MSGWNSKIASHLKTEVSKGLPPKRSQTLSEFVCLYLNFYNYMNSRNISEVSLHSLKINSNINSVAYIKMQIQRYLVPLSPLFLTFLKIGLISPLFCLSWQSPRNFKCSRYVDIFLTYFQKSKIFSDTHTEHKN